MNHCIEGRPHPYESAPKKVAAKLFNVQEGRETLSSVHGEAEPSQLLIGMWLFAPFETGFPPSDNPVLSVIGFLGFAEANSH